MSLCWQEDPLLTVRQTPYTKACTQRWQWCIRVCVCVCVCINVSVCASQTLLRDLCQSDLPSFSDPGPSPLFISVPQESATHSFPVGLHGSDGGEKTESFSFFLFSWTCQTCPSSVSVTTTKNGPGVCFATKQYCSFTLQTEEAFRKKERKNLLWMLVQEILRLCFKLCFGR